MILIIPVLNNCVLAISIDFKKQEERILIGEVNNARNLLFLKNPFENTVESPTKLYCLQTRPLGTLILECCDPSVKKLWDLAKLIKVDKLKKNELETILYNKFLVNNNLICVFFALRIWQEYNQLEFPKNIKKLYDTMQSLSEPFIFSFERTIINSEKYTDGLASIADTYYKYYYPNQGGHLYSKNLKNSNTEYIFADSSLLYVIFYYMNSLYSNKKFLQRCKVCNSLFFAHTAKIPTICNPACKKKQAQLNSKKHANKIKNISYEKKYKNNYMYWLYNVNKLKESQNIDQEKLNRVSTEFNNFRKQAILKKNDVKKKKLSAIEFENWLLKQRDIIDNLIND